MGDRLPSRFTSDGIAAAHKTLASLDVGRRRVAQRAWETDEFVLDPSRITLSLRRDHTMARV